MKHIYDHKTIIDAVQVVPEMQHGAIDQPSGF